MNNQYITLATRTECQIDKFKRLEQDQLGLTKRAVLELDKTEERSDGDQFIRISGGTNKFFECGISRFLFKDKIINSIIDDGSIFICEGESPDDNTLYIVREECLYLAVYTLKNTRAEKSLIASLLHSKKLITLLVLFKLEILKKLIAA